MRLRWKIQRSFLGILSPKSVDAVLYKFSFEVVWVSRQIKLGVNGHELLTTVRVMKPE